MRTIPILRLIFALVIPGSTLSGVTPVAAQPASTLDFYELYGKLTGKTVLRPGALPPLSLSAPDSDESKEPQTETIGRIEAALADAKLEIIPDGNLFVWIVPPGLSNSPAMKLLAKIPRPTTRSETSTPLENSIPAGAINFINLPVEQTLAIYADLRQRTILRPAVLPAPPISFRTQTPLTREEAVYALNVVLLFNRLAAIDDGEKFVQVVPARMAAQVVAGSPAPDANEPLMDPAKVPRIGFLAGSGSKSAPPIAATLLAFYAELTGQQPSPEQEFGGFPIAFNVQTPLRKGELLYAIKTTLNLSGLTIVADAGRVRLERIGR